jgi:hypothetical protein
VVMREYHDASGRRDPSDVSVTAGGKHFKSSTRLFYYVATVYIYIYI